MTPVALATEVITTPRRYDATRRREQALHTRRRMRGAAGAGSSERYEHRIVRQLAAAVLPAHLDDPAPAIQGERASGSGG